MHVEEIPDSGLTVLRGRIDPALAHDFQEEWLMSLDEVASRKGFNNLGVGVLTLLEEADFFVDQESACGRVLQALSVARHGLIMAINYQSPEGAQVFHRDDTYTIGSVTIIHGADGGAFDYAPLALNEVEAEEVFRTVELNVGDVVLQSRPLQWHRGRNLSDSPRITAALAARGQVSELLPDFSL